MFLSFFSGNLIIFFLIGVNSLNHESRPVCVLRMNRTFSMPCLLSVFENKVGFVSDFYFYRILPAVDILQLILATFPNKRLKTSRITTCSTAKEAVNDIHIYCRRILPALDTLPLILATS